MAKLENLKTPKESNLIRNLHNSGIGLFQNTSGWFDSKGNAFGLLRDTEYSVRKKRIQIALGSSFKRAFLGIHNTKKRKAKCQGANWNV